MIILLKAGVGREQAGPLLRRMMDAGADGMYVTGRDGRGLIVARGRERAVRDLHLESHPLVERLVPIDPAYEHARRRADAIGTTVTLGSQRIGGRLFAIVAGPPCVETRRQFLSTAMMLKESGAHALRGDVFRVRPHTDSFEGVGLKGMDVVREVARQTGLPIVTGVTSPSDVAALESQVEGLQVPGEYMADLRLLDALGESRLPVILTRGTSATLDDLLLSAERILQRGNRGVILCEQGIRAVANPLRATLDLVSVPELRRLTHLPLVVDPSRRASSREDVLPLAAAALAVGADGLLLDVHVRPEEARVGGQTTLAPAGFKQLMNKLQPLAKAVGRDLVRG